MPDPVGDFSIIWPYLAVFVASYLIGAVPFGLILTRIAGAGDIRKIGSGNIGATNVLRTGRRSLAALTLILDAAKGAVPVALADHLLFRDQAVLAGVGAILGHMLPIYLIASSKNGALLAIREAWLLVIGTGIALLGKSGTSLVGVAMLASSTLFAWGGKGVATGLGVLIAISPVVGILTCLTWLIVALIFRYSSLAAIAAFLGAPVFAWLLADTAIGSVYLSDPQRTEFAAFVALVVLIRHGGNMRRLLSGKEPRIGGKEPRIGGKKEGGSTNT
jgi:glycerol-3-phosphate acyltransferase PlsY